MRTGVMLGAEMFRTSSAFEGGGIAFDCAPQSLRFAQDDTRGEVLLRGDAVDTTASAN